MEQAFNENGFFFPLLSMVVSLTGVGININELHPYNKDLYPVDLNTSGISSLIPGPRFFEGRSMHYD